MHAFPRLHPLWHKARIGFPSPSAVSGNFSFCFPPTAVEVIVNPGDVLYLPPYVWHTVETLSPSVSLVSLSHDDGLRKTMESIYAHDFKFDLLVEREGKVAALRLFLDLAVTMLYVQTSLGKRFVYQLPYHDCELVYKQTVNSSLFTNSYNAQKECICLYCESEPYE